MSQCLSGLSHASCFEPATNFVGSTPRIATSCECRVQNTQVAESFPDAVKCKSNRDQLLSGTNAPTDAVSTHLSAEPRHDRQSISRPRRRLIHTKQHLISTTVAACLGCCFIVLSLILITPIINSKPHKNGYPLHHPHPPPGCPPRRRRSLHRARASSGELHPSHTLSLISLTPPP